MRLESRETFAVLLGSALLLGAGALTQAQNATPAKAPAAAPAAPAPAASVGKIEVLKVRGDIYMLTNADGENVTVQAGKEGPLLVNTGEGQWASELIATIGRITPKPIRYIINTNGTMAHSGGNEAVAKVGRGIGGGNVNMAIEGAQIGATVVAHENVLTRMTNEKIAYERWPTLTYFTRSKDMYFGDEAVRIFHLPNAQTDGDSVVFFRRSDVVSVGGIVDVDHYPYIDVKAGGSINGTIEAINRLIDLAVPEHHQDGGTLIIPGRGRVIDELDLVEYRDMLTIVRSYVQEMIKEGKSLQQVVAAKPTYSFDSRYGFDSSSPMTNDQFVTLIYNELKRPRSARPSGPPDLS